MAVDRAASALAVDVLLILSGASIVVLLSPGEFKGLLGEPVTREEALDALAGVKVASMVLVNHWP